MTLAVAVSGGVDSLCALLKLQEAGADVCALHARFLPAADGLSQSLIARLKDRALDVLTLDLRKSFQDEVLTPSLLSWHQGATPNPCALCNRTIKFGLLLKEALKLGFSGLATGHYARLERVEGQLLLGEACDKSKDQSYFLSLIDAKALAKLRFPLSNMHKDACRSYLASRGFLAESRQPESQDVCFLPPKHELAAFLTRAWAEQGLAQPEPGPLFVVNAQGQKDPKKRSHQGLWHYTEGQRRGLGVSGSEGFYVLKKDPKSNSLLIGPRSLLGMTALTADQLNLFCPPERWPQALQVKVRYRQKPVACKARLVQDTLQISFSEAQFPTAKGQLVSLATRQGYILAGGVVKEMVLSADQWL